MSFRISIMFDINKWISPLINNLTWSWEMFQVSHRRLCLQGSNIFLLFFVQFPDFFKMIISSPLTLRSTCSQMFINYQIFNQNYFLTPPGSLPVHVSRATCVLGRSLHHSSFTLSLMTIFKHTHSHIYIHSQGYCVWKSARTKF